MNEGIKWNELSPDERNSLIKRYKGGESGAVLAREIGMPAQTFYSHMSQNRIIKDMNKTGSKVGRGFTALSPQQQQDIKRRYKQGESLTKLAEEYSISIHSARRGIKKLSSKTPTLQSTPQSDFSLEVSGIRITLSLPANTSVGDIGIDNKNINLKVV